MGFLKELKEVSISVLPIALIATILSFSFGAFSEEVPFWQFLLSVLLIIVGLSLFLLGVGMGFVPVGNHIGQMVTKKHNIWLLISVGLFLGVIITIAEPDVEVLTEQVVSINPKIDKFLLVLMISLGVGIFMALSYIRTLTGFSIKITLALGVALLLLAAAFVPEFFVSVAFDSGGATTGPMAVPFILALGLGVSATRNGKESDSFGYAGMASIGPVLFVLILGIFSKGDIGLYESGVMSMSLSERMLHTLREVSIALLPLIAIAIIVQFFFMRLPRIRAIRLFVGIFYAWVGLVLFLFAVKSSFMPLATTLGREIGGFGYWLLILIGIAFGAVVVLAEPAIWVLTGEVEAVSQGRIRRGVMLLFMSIGVSSAVLLSMLRIIYGLSIWYFLLPGYALILILMPFSSTLFVGIAFDSGGVATGPMSSTFLLPFAIGAATVVSNDIQSASFGMIGLIAMMPILSIEILGVIYSVTIKRAERSLK